MLLGASVDLARLIRTKDLRFAVLGSRYVIIRARPGVSGRVRGENQFGTDRRVRVTTASANLGADVGVAGRGRV